MSREKYRVGDGPGPDYKCHKCGLQGHRMWRQGASSCVELTCAVCSEEQERAAGHMRQEPRPDYPESNIGYLVPCRVDKDQSIWGHTSGDCAWWYRMPQYTDPAREAHQVRLERDYFQREQERFGEMWLKADREANQFRRERDEAFRVAKIQELPE